MALTGKLPASSYGLTELSWIFLNKPETTGKNTILGRPAPGVEVRLLDKAGQEVANGQTGEISARSPKVMSGYLDDLGMPAAHGAEWIRTGDLAHRDEDGDYWFDGRIKDMISLNTGDLVSPVEVENATLGISGVRNCFVVGMPVRDSRLGSMSEQIWAIVVRNDPGLTEEKLLESLGSKLSSYKLPHRSVFFEEVPRGLSGKISRRQLKRWLLDNLGSLPEIPS